MPPAPLHVPNSDPEATPDPVAALPALAAVLLTPELFAALSQVAARSNPNAGAPRIPLTSELLAVLRGELEPSPHDHSYFALHLRLYQQ